MKIHIRANDFILESHDLSKVLKEIEDGKWRLKELYRGRPHWARVVKDYKYKG